MWCTTVVYTTACYVGITARVVVSEYRASSSAEELEVVSS